MHAVPRQRFEWSAPVAFSMIVERGLDMAVVGPPRLRRLVDCAQAVVRQRGYAIPGRRPCAGYAE